MADIDAKYYITSKSGKSSAAHVQWLHPFRITNELGAVNQVRYLGFKFAENRVENVDERKRLRKPEVSRHACSDNFLRLSEVSFGLENLLGDKTSNFWCTVDSIKAEGARDDILLLIRRLLCAAGTRSLTRTLTHSNWLL